MKLEFIGGLTLVGCVILLFAGCLYVTQPECKEGFKPVWIHYNGWECIMDGRKR